MRQSILLAGCAALLAPPLLADIHAFDVDVDGRAVGSHRFEVSTLPTGAQQVRSRAVFTYRVLGVTLYRYVHEADELWLEGCVSSLRSQTDDDGRRIEVKAAAAPDDGSLEIVTGAASRRERGCIRSFAYWDPSLLGTGRLLNPQTGELQSVRLEELAPVSLRLDAGGDVLARRLRLSGDALQIDLWYGAAGEWLQLESRTAEGRRLRYRRIGAQ